MRTFGDLRIDDADSALPPEQSYKLVVIVSDVSCGRRLRLPWDYHQFGLDPDEQPVADAVRASASIPFFFRPAKLSSPGTRDIWYCTDGGMLSNFPVDLFDRRDGSRPRWPTFGIKLSGRPASGAEHSRNAKPITGLLDLSMALVETTTSAHDRLHLAVSTAAPGCCADVPQIAPTGSVRGGSGDVGLDVGEHAAAVPGREGPYKP